MADGVDQTDFNATDAVKCGALTFVAAGFTVQGWYCDRRAQKNLYQRIAAVYGRAFHRIGHRFSRQGA